MTTFVDIAAAIIGVVVVGLLRVVWSLAERVARLEGMLDDDPTKRERRG